MGMPMWATGAKPPMGEHRRPNTALSAVIYLLSNGCFSLMSQFPLCNVDSMLL